MESVEGAAIEVEAAGRYVDVIERLAPLALATNDRLPSKLRNQTGPEEDSASFHHGCFSADIATLVNFKC